MLKKRVIAVIFVSQGISVQSIGFRKYLPVGRPEIAAEAFNSWGVDEIVLIDMDATQHGRLIQLSMVKKVASKCSVPLTVGGGVKTVDDISRLLEAGADKVFLNSEILDGGFTLKKASQKYGCQCMVGGIDFLRLAEQPQVFDYRSRKTISKSIIEVLHQYIELGCGELFVNDVGRDGSGEGFDTDLMSQVSQTASVPVIWCGGAGHPDHFLQALRVPSISGVAAGNIFHFFEHSVNIIKSRANTEIPLRRDTQLDYLGAPLTDEGRVGKISERVLDELLYEKLEVEII